MNFQDFERKYTRLMVCRLYNDDEGHRYSRILLKGEWKGNAGTLFILFICIFIYPFILFISSFIYLFNFFR
jgi:hypothetical protein